MHGTDRLSTRLFITACGAAIALASACSNVEVLDADGGIER
jgi:hypothetical protein